MTEPLQRPRMQAIGFWWLLIPLVGLPFDTWVDAWWGNDLGRWVFYTLRGIGIFLAAEVFPSIIRQPWPLRMFIGSLLGWLIGALVAPVTFLIMPTERARAINTMSKEDILTQFVMELFFSFITVSWLVGAIYFTYGRFRESPQAKLKVE